MIQVHVEASTAQELQHKLIDLARIFGHEPNQMSLPVQTEPAPKRGKKATAKTEAAPLTQEEKTAAESSAQETEGEYSEADVLTAVEKLTQTQGKGIPAARKVLKEFNAAKVSEVKPDQYGAIIDALNKEAAS